MQTETSRRRATIGLSNFNSRGVGPIVVPDAIFSNWGEHALRNSIVKALLAGLLVPNREPPEWKSILKKEKHLGRKRDPRGAEKSELSDVNRRAGEGPVKVSPTLFEHLKTARGLSEVSGGAFDATVASLPGLWSLNAEAPRSAHCRSKRGLQIWWKGSGEGAAGEETAWARSRSLAVAAV